MSLRTNISSSAGLGEEEVEIKKLSVLWLV